MLLFSSCLVCWSPSYAKKKVFFFCGEEREGGTFGKAGCILELELELELRDQVGWIP